MEDVASMLKRTREEKGISLKDAATETHVSAGYLQILEGEGDPRLLADALYLIPFLRAYSTFLGLDPAVTVPQFLTAVQKGDPLSLRSETRGGGLFSRSALIVLIVVGIAALSWFWISGQNG